MATVAPQEIIDGIMAVRETGEVNMLDRRGVQYVADQLGLYAVVVYLEDHPREYAEGIFRGFAQATPDPDAAPAGQES